MPLPEGFSEWEHLQDQIIRIHNRQVRDYFSDIVEDNDLTTPRGSLRHACLMKDEDTSVMTQLRLWLFEVTAGHAKSLQPDIYGLPVTTFQERYTFAPQVQLYFLEPATQTENGYPQVEGEISFRLTEPEYENVTPTEARNLARRIKSVLATPPFVWKKGRILCTYKDEKKGYNFQIYVTSETEARRVIEQVLDIRTHTPEWDYLTVHESRRNFPIVPPTKTIYGKSRRLPRQRPRADVRFRYAALHLHGVPNAITLVSTGNSRRNALETA
ncbi:MAG: hypothetical protein B0A82_05800 [Alkalinema sp. CACIAM 70d]|nr:MAG: hypothetical protein B0A82_05800 [Alkalinema sp. CACIAM 70d]